MFHNRGAAYHHLDDMAMVNDNLGTSNKMYRAINADLKGRGIKSSARTLGIIDRMVTQPLWRILAAPDVHMLDMNEDYPHQET